jgi:hypothetical protein
MEGPASVAGAYLSGWFRTGHWDMSKGTFYNFNDRYGANGYQLLRDLYDNSNTFWGIVLGASGSVMYNNLKSATPFVYAWTSAYNDEQDNPFKLTISDWKNGLDNINSFKAGDRLAYAVQFGKWLDRHGRPQQDIGTIDAIFRTLLGTTDQKIDDLYLLHKIQQERTENYKQASYDYMENMRLQAEAIKNNDIEQAKDYGRRANFVLQSRQVPPEEAAKIFAQTRSLLQNQQDLTYDSFYHKLVPSGQEAGHSEAYKDLKK